MAGLKPSDIILVSKRHEEPRKRFMAALDDVCAVEGWREREVVSAFLEAGFLALRGRLLRGDPFVRNEARYMALVGRCRDKHRTMGRMSEMLAVTSMALRLDPVDFLGPIFSATMASDRLGQFFTPWAVSEMIARMVLSDAVGLLDTQDVITCCEPACGVGGMVLAASRVLWEEGLYPPKHVLWTMIDVDYSAMCGAYIQASFCDVAAYVVHGNALTSEVWVSTPTPAALLHSARSFAPMMEAG